MIKRLQNLPKSLTKARRTVKDYAFLPFRGLSEKQKFLSGFVFLCLATTFLISNPFWRPAVEQYKEGDIARESIISPADIFVADAEETERKRRTVSESVHPIFTYDANRAVEAVQSFRSAWESL